MLKEEEEEERITGHEQRMEGKERGGERRGGIFFKGLRRILIQLGAKEEERGRGSLFSIFFFCAPHGFSLRKKLSPRGHRLPPFFRRDINSRPSEEYFFSPFQQKPTSTAVKDILFSDAA